MVLNGSCPIVRTVEFISRRWTLHIFRELKDHKRMRFNELMHELPGISTRTLAQRLRDMETEGFVSKKEFAEIPPRVEYALTAKGKEFMRCLVQFERWCAKTGGLKTAKMKV